MFKLLAFHLPYKSVKNKPVLQVPLFLSLNMAQNVIFWMDVVKCGPFYCSFTIEGNIVRQHNNIHPSTEDDGNTTLL